MLTTIPNGLDEIIATFGSLDTPDFEKLNIVSLTFPYALSFGGKPVIHERCHKLTVEHFQKAFQGILDAGLQDQVKDYGGIYNQRAIRSQESHPSTHSWGIAIDVEPEAFPLGSDMRFPDGIVKIFQDAGFFYGGDFKSRKDPMHFQ